MKKLEHYIGFKHFIKMARLKLINKQLLFLPVALLCLSISAAAQFYNQRPEFLNANKHWAFGEGSGLEFSTGTALSWTNSVTGGFSYEGYSTVSDPSTGELLFYTNGGSVWNKNHQIMPNGTGLMGNSFMELYSSHQGTLIVPFISDKENEKPTKYYLFSLTWGARLDTNSAKGAKGSLYYNVVDMELASGNGDVAANLKNMVLDTAVLSEAMIAIPGCNNDIWVLVHSSYQPQPIYKAYHITKDGINTTPVISSSNIRMDPVLHDGESLTISPDRTKIIFTAVSKGAELSSFDPATGIVSSSVTFKTLPSSDFWSFYNGYYRGVFSPDNNQLYLTSHYMTYPYHMGYILQYDITKMDSTIIELSKDTVAAFGGDTTTLNSTKGFVGTGLRLYNDTIYVSDFVSSYKMHRINQPNQKGVANDFQWNAITLTAENPIYFLGSEVVQPLPLSLAEGNTLDTIICRGLDTGVLLSPPRIFEGYTYVWSTGDTAVQTKISKHGTYWVKYLDGCGLVDTIIVSKTDLFTSISVNENTLSASQGPFESYQWYFNEEKIEGATNTTYTVTQNGTYSVEATDEYGCAFLSDPYIVNNATSIESNPHLPQIVVFPNPTENVLHINSPVSVDVTLLSIEGRIVNTYTDAKTVLLNALSKGTYLLHIHDKKGNLIKAEKVSKL